MELHLNFSAVVFVFIRLVFVLISFRGISRFLTHSKRIDYITNQIPLQATIRWDFFLLLSLYSKNDENSKLKKKIWQAKCQMKTYKPQKCRCVNATVMRLPCGSPVKYSIGINYCFGCDLNSLSLAHSLTQARLLTSTNEYKHDFSTTLHI